MSIFGIFRLASCDDGNSNYYYDDPTSSNPTTEEPVNTGSEDSLEYLIDGNINDFGIVAPENYITIYKGNNSGRTDHSLLHYIIAKVPGWSINDSDIDGTLWDKKITIDEDNINL